MNSSLEFGFRLLSTSAAILLTWILWVAVFVGWGILLWRVHGEVRLDVQKILMCFWAGFAMVVLFLQFWHLALPVNGPALVAILMTGGLGLLWNLRAAMTWWQGVNFRHHRLGMIAVLLAGLWLANRASGPCTAYDSGMYHIPWVRWISTYAVVPGLGNLHDRLAFNSSSLLYAALLNVGPWHGRVTHIANGLLVFALLLQACLALLRLRSGCATKRWQDAFDLFLLAPVTLFAFDEYIASLSTDVAPAIVCLVASSFLLGWLNLPNEEQRKDLHSPMIVLVLLGLSVCLKLSTIGFSVTAIAALIWKLQRINPRWWAARQIRWGAGLVFCLAITHAALGAALSGYPLYPSTFGGVHTTWRVPSELADAQREWVTIGARRSALHGLAWLPEWIRANCRWPRRNLFFFGVGLPLLVALLAMIATAFVSRGKGAQPSQGKETTPLFIALLAGIVLWFALTPNPRFGLHLFWIAAALNFARLFHAPGGDSQNREGRLVTAALAISFLPVVVPVARVLAAEGFGKPGRAFQVLFVTPGPDRGLHPLPVAELSAYTTKSGLVVSVPVKDNCCWDAELPCTPHPAPNLVQKAGMDGRPLFATEGNWQQLNWPNTVDKLAKQWRERTANDGR